MVVIKYIFLLLLALAAITYAAPAMLSISIRARVCSPENMLVDVSDYSCPKTNEIDKGHCASTIPNIPNKEGCSAYCEVRLTKRFGQEMPISNSHCTGSGSCSVSKGESQTYTNTFEINVGLGGEIAEVLESTFNIGASYSYSSTLGYTSASDHRQELKDNECGYWTFIPFMMESCGILTEAATVSSPGGWGQNSIFTYSCDKDRLFDTTNWCQTTPYKNVAGSAAGETIFVFTDCNGGAVMWEKMKNKPIYSYPGVSTAQKPT